MYPTSMCGKPHPTSFRTLTHSGRVCRLLSEPETGSFLPCSGDADIVADQPAGPVHAIFGGVPRPTPRGVLDSSPYAYLEAVSLVLAEWLEARREGGFGGGMWASLALYREQCG